MSFKVVSLRDTSLAARQLLEVGAAVLVVVLVRVVLAGEITSSFLTPSNPVSVFVRHPSSRVGWSSH